MIELTSNWTNFNRVGQIGRIDGLDDSIRTILFELFKKIQKKLVMPAFAHTGIFTFYVDQWVGQKGSEATCRCTIPNVGYIFYI